MYKILANTLFFGKNVVFVPECHSTNSLLLDLTRKISQPEGTILITTQQSKGRGQLGSSWESESGKNLTLSLLLKPNFLAVKQQFYLTMAVSLGVCDFLTERLSGYVKIKWPNDILVNDRKVAGILIENTLTGEKLEQSVVGIGLNVNQTVFAATNATSMAIQSDNAYDLVTEFGFLAEKLEKRYLQLRSGRASEIKMDYLKNLYRIGEACSFVSNDRIFLGSIDGIEESGKLRIRSNGLLLFFGLKEIAFFQ